MWNVNAREFTPTQANSCFRAEAPEFVPILSVSSLKLMMQDLIMNEGISGIPLRQIPERFKEKNGCSMDLSGSPFADVSSLIASIEEVSLVEAEGPRNLAEAMHEAGFSVCVESFPETVTRPMVPAVSEEAINLGLDADKVAILSIYVNFVEDLGQFRQSIVDVVHNFSMKNGSQSINHSGLALSLFAAEWDRYHSVRGIAADLKGLRERFFVVKLMPFLQSIPELDVVGAHPEVRVRIRSGVVCQSVPPSPKRKPTWTGSPLPSPDTSTFDGYSVGGGPRNISLNSELFGTDDSSIALSRPNTPLKNSEESQTRVVLEEMLASTQAQILGILSQAPTDPLAAADAIEQMNQLQVLVNALKAALAVLPVPRKTISIEKAIFGDESEKKTKKTISLDSLLSPSLIPASSCPPSPLSAAVGAAPGVGNLLADLSRILFAQVIQQQQTTPETTVRETSLALERTLAEIVSAASSPPSSPASHHENKAAADCSALVSGQLIIPQSLPTSPISIAPQSVGTTPSQTTLNLSNAFGSAEENMHNLLKGLMTALPPPGLPTADVVERKSPPFKRLTVRPLMPTDFDKRVYGKETLLAFKVFANGLNESPPQELRGLSCKQILRVAPTHRQRKAEDIVPA